MMRWDEIYTSVFIKVESIVNNIPHNNLLSAIPICEIKKYIKSIESSEKDPSDENVLEEGAFFPIELEKDDIVSELDDWDIINEYNSRGLYHVNDVDKWGNSDLTDFLKNRYGLFVNAYSNDEICSFIKEQLDKEKY